ncbi:MAG: SDR family oxidoreductase [Thalassobaculales bacterium]
MPVVLITGASRGIGAATAIAAAEAGWDVAVNYHSAAAAAETVAAAVRRHGRKAVVIQADTSTEAGVVGMFEAFDAAFDRLDGLVNNAGITGPFRRLVDLEEAVLEQVLRTNVIGCFMAAREAARRMSTARGGSGGSIVNVSSIAARRGGAGEWVHYAASKGALDSMTIGLAQELGPEGIRVNGVRPGLIITDIHATAGMPDRPDRLAPSVPLGRAGTAEEAAAGILFLLSPAASYVSGAIIDIGGGR